MINKINSSTVFTSKVFIPLRNVDSPNMGSLTDYDRCRQSRFKTYIQKLEQNENDDRVTIFTKPCTKPNAMDDILVVRVAEINEEGRSYIGQAEKYGVVPANIPKLYEEARADMHPRSISILNDYIV